MDAAMTEEMKRFNYLANEIDGAYHEAAVKLGLSDSAMLILYTICENGEECLLHDIICSSGVSKQTINSSLRKLEGEGIVFLKASGDKRKTVCLTEKGRALVKTAVLPIIEIENEIFASWTEPERRLYIELTQRYLNSFREKIRKL